MSECDRVDTPCSEEILVLTDCPKTPVTNTDDASIARNCFIPLESNFIPVGA